MSSSSCFFYWATLSTFLSICSTAAFFFFRETSDQAQQPLSGESETPHGEQHDDDVSSATAGPKRSALAFRTVTYICVPGAWQQQEAPAGCQTKANVPEARPGEVVYVTKGEVLAWGGTAILERLPSGLVVKTPIPNPYRPAEEKAHRHNMCVEAQVYSKIGKHPCFPTMVDWDQETCCLTMEYLENGNLKDYVRQHSQTITSHLRLQWVRQAVEALTALHNVDVIHCDISPRNFLLDPKLNLKICDFGGASISGKEPSATPATRFRHPDYNWDAPPLFKDDIFSMGSLIYFILTGKYPYEETSSDEVEARYEARQFPDLSNVICGSIIHDCWYREVDTAEAVLNLLTAAGKNKTSFSEIGSYSANTSLHGLAE